MEFMAKCERESGVDKNVKESGEEEEYEEGEL